MGHRFRLTSSILVILSLFYLLVTNNCTHDEPCSRIEDITVFEEIKPTDEVKNPIVNLCEKKNEQKITNNTNTPPPYHIVIPGRTTNSGICKPGEHNSIVMDDVSLSIPSGALKQTTTISITGLFADDLPPLPDEISNVTRNLFAGYRFLPHGMIFDSAASISVAYDKNLIPEGYTSDDIYTFYYDETDFNLINS